ncbi:hypothetical protein [Candidatus Phytoplasma pini]|uniref:Uncharacterized protein n=1 Tax=Candidatus Phytoplasma pini TaxID=267362 RepID=A0A559KJE5_9MOLU|nr:hypothetical protein [Candidatus Phytoplasma pini]TVY12227.1 hypothetical protein MDPP_00235 [Candidatus Phytoplasma pini]
MLNYLSSYWRYLQNFFSFSAGLFCGFLLFGLLYIIFVIKKISSGFNNLGTENDILNNQEMENLIKKTQLDFIEDIKKNKDDYLKFLWQHIKNLTLTTSSSFYPKSQYPYLELTLDESLALIRYLHDRIEFLFQQKIISIFKKMTLKNFFILKTNLVDKKYFDKAKKVNKFANFISNTVNILNPFHWIKKIFFRFFYDTLINKIGCAIILIVGEEVYKIYSKKIFQSEQDINQILKELQDEINKQKEQNIE